MTDDIDPRELRVKKLVAVDADALAPAEAKARLALIRSAITGRTK